MVEIIFCYNSSNNFPPKLLPSTSSDPHVPGSNPRRLVFAGHWVSCGEKGVQGHPVRKTTIVKSLTLFILCPYTANKKSFSVKNQLITMCRKTGSEVSVDG